MFKKEIKRFYSRTRIPIKQGDQESHKRVWKAEAADSKVRVVNLMYGFRIDYEPYLFMAMGMGWRSSSLNLYVYIKNQIKIIYKKP